MLLSTLSNRTNSVSQLLTVLLLFVFVIAITWGTTRWIAKIQKGQMANGVNIEVIETCRISADQFLQIIRVGQKYVLISVGKTETHMITELKEDELVLDSQENKGMDFASVLDKFRNKNPKSD